jgi:hypothetical protein
MPIVAAFEDRPPLIRRGRLLVTDNRHRTFGRAGIAQPMTVEEIYMGRQRIPVERMPTPLEWIFPREEEEMPLIAGEAETRFLGEELLRYTDLADHPMTDWDGDEAALDALAAYAGGRDVRVPTFRMGNLCIETEPVEWARERMAQREAQRSQERRPRTLPPTRSLVGNPLLTRGRPHSVRVTWWSERSRRIPNPALSPGEIRPM